MTASRFHGATLAMLRDWIENGKIELTDESALEPLADELLAWLTHQRPLKLGARCVAWLMKREEVEEVYADDADFEKDLVALVEEEAAASRAERG